MKVLCAFALLSSLWIVSCGSSSTSQPPASNEKKSLQLGDSIDFTTPEGNPYLVGIGGGWGGPEPNWGDWMLGTDAELAFNLPDAVGKDLVFDADVRAFVPEQRPHSEVEVKVNGTHVATWAFERTAFGKGEVGHQQAVVPKTLVGSPTIRVSFHGSDPRSPAEFHLSGDGRKMTFALVKLSLKKG